MLRISEWKKRLVESNILIWIEYLLIFTGIFFLKDTD